MERIKWIGLPALICLAGCAAGTPTKADTDPVVGGPPIQPGGAIAGTPGGPLNPGPPRTGTGDVPTPPAGAGTGGAPVQVPMNMAGMGPMNTGGAGQGAGGNTAAGNGATAGMNAMPMPMPGSGKPVIPTASGECPNLDRDGSITLGGLSGISVVAAPKPASPTAPLVFYWHGTGSFAGEYAGSASAVVAGVRAEGGVLISFQGTTGGDLLSGTAIFGKGDFDLADTITACAVKDHNVDPTRIFATGCSAGGLFSGAMAAARANYMAAVAPNSGGWTVPVAFQTGAMGWTPALMTMHGAAGVDVVIIDFSNSSKTADTAFKARGGFVINCDHGGIHCGGGGLSGDVWKFFKAHPYGTNPSPWKDALPAGFSSQCKLF